MCDDYGDSKYQQPPPRDPDGASWFYYDNDNVEFGPYTGMMIKHWFDQGFVQVSGDRTRVRRTSWSLPEFIMVAYDDLLINFCNPKCNHFVSPPHLRGAVYVAYGVTQTQLAIMTKLGQTELGQKAGFLWMWHFLDNDNTDQGPFTADQMAEWYQKSLFPKGAGTEIRLGH